MCRRETTFQSSKCKSNRTLAIRCSIREQILAVNHPLQPIKMLFYGCWPLRFEDVPLNPLNA